MKKKSLITLMVGLISLLIASAIYCEKVNADENTGRFINEIELIPCWYNDNDIELYNPFAYSDNFLLVNSNEINADIVKASATISGAAYDVKKVKEVLSNMGYSYDEDDIHNYDKTATLDDNAFVAYTISKKIINNQYLIYCIPIRGTYELYEWYSNFELNNEMYYDDYIRQGDHTGFYKASESIYEDLNTQISIDNPNNDLEVIVWITGHSRGAAVSNVLAGKINDNNLIKSEHLFCYTFACPAVSKNIKNNQKYTNIYNFNNPADLVTEVPPKSWGYDRYGITKTLDVSDFENFKNRYYATHNQEYYLGMSCEAKLNAMEDFLANENELSEEFKLFTELLIWAESGEKFDKSSLLIGGIADLDKHSIQIILSSVSPESYVRNIENAYIDIMNCKKLFEQLDADEVAKWTDSELAVFLSKNSTTIQKAEAIAGIDIKDSKDLVLVMLSVSSITLNRYLKTVNIVKNILAILNEDNGQLISTTAVQMHRQATYVLWINSMYYGYEGWSGNRDLKTVDLEGVNTIGPSCFYECRGLTDVKWSNYLYAGGYSFAWTGITDVYIPNNAICNYAFYGCNCVKEVTIPIDYPYDEYHRPFEHLQYIGGGGSIPKIETIHYTYGNTGIMPDRDSSYANYCIEYISTKTLKNIDFEEGITRIGNNAFAAYGDWFEGSTYVVGALENISFPDSLTSIGEGAFRSQKNLSKVNLPLGIKDIPDYCFCDCNNIKNYKDITSHNIYSIGYQAFKNTGISEFEIKPEVEYKSGALSGMILDCLIIPVDYKYPKEKGEQFYGLRVNKIQYTKGESGVMPNRDPQQLYNNYTPIPDNWYRWTLEYSCMQGVEEIRFDDEITRIGNYGFYGYNVAYSSVNGNITSIKWPGALDSIGEYAFYNQKHIRVIELPDKVSEISDYAFSNCDNLTDIIIPPSVTTIGSNAFYKSNGLKSIYGEKNSYAEEYANIHKIDFIPLQYPVIDIQGDLLDVNMEYILNAKVYLSVDNYVEGFNYSISGNNSTNTTIDNNGRLFIGNDETATQIEIQLSKGKDTYNLNYYIKGHDWDEGVVLTPATCTEQGEIMYTCPRCLATRTDAIQAYGHDEEIIPAVDPTCLEHGKTEGKKCSICGEVLVKQEDIEPLGHDYQVVEGSAAEVTCISDGKLADTKCSRCGDVIVGEPVKTTGHNVIIDPAVDPTCMESGLTQGTHCSICNSVIEPQNVVLALGHNWDEGITTKQATDDNDGEKLFTCERCKETKIETIHAYGHDWDEGVVLIPATCTENGEILYTCQKEECKATSTDAIQAKGHMEVVDEAVEPTCTETGLSEGTHCSVCNEIIIEQKEVAALGHEPVKDDAVAATYTTTGLTEGSHCSVCNTVLSEQEEIPCLSGLYRFPSDGIWYYMCDGKVNDAFTGIVRYNEGKTWYFVREGKLDKKYSGVAQATNGIWYYVTKGKIDRTFTGQIAKATNGRYYYISKGKPTKNYDQKMAYCPADKKYYYCSNGRVDFSFSGKLAYCTDGNWYYVKKGKIDTSFTGIAEATNGKLYYTKNGKLDRSYSGTAKYNGKSYKVVKGVVK